MEESVQLASRGVTAERGAADGGGGRADASAEEVGVGGSADRERVGCSHMTVRRYWGPSAVSRS